MWVLVLMCCQQYQLHGLWKLIRDTSTKIEISWYRTWIHHHSRIPDQTWISNKCLSNRVKLVKLFTNSVQVKPSWFMIIEFISWRPCPKIFSCRVTISFLYRGTLPIPVEISRKFPGDFLEIFPTPLPPPSPPHPLDRYPPPPDPLTL